MSLEKAKNHLAKFGLEDRVIELEQSSETVELAAKALGVTEDEIAKSLSFDLKGETVVILLAGERKIDNKLFKAFFKAKAKMVPFDEVKDRTGYEPGGVCPFGLNDDVKIYLDNSLKDYEFIYPACGTGNSAVKLSIEDLEKSCNFIDWISISKR